MHKLTKISIIIIVKNDPSVALTLDKVQGCVDKVTELIVVYVGDSVKEITKKYPWVRFVEFKNTIKKSITIAEQRNLGISTAKGQYIVFLDSGCMPISSKWLSRLTEPMYSGNLISVGSVCTDDNNFTIGNPPSNHHKYINEFSTLNICLNKKIFNKIGLFDEKLLYGSDVDLAIRSKINNIHAYNSYKAQVKHTDFKKSEKYSRSYWYGFGRGCLIRKYIQGLFIFRFQSQSTNAFIFVSLVYLTLTLSMVVLLIINLYISICIALIFLTWSVFTGKTFRGFINKILYGYGIIRGFIFYPSTYNFRD